MDSDNLVLMPCPKCEGGYGVMYIPAISFEYDRFYLDDAYSILKKLDIDQMQHLVLHVKRQKYFCCTNENCLHVFSYDVHVKQDRKLEILREILIDKV